ncbi:hypothetical protein K435DRAFT_961538 [Dendrothele bispora CBS 962.96]|uniref:Arrestin C-terminal-like domain-containing protein n=1 Tax=Dendrothele bispora (strain CBS 962.96) TaxID=1314807 RepID=A0A4S8MRC1_DENBC|nr:hypothetical protein K435DRAFT_961538 [Dendrothele bispora CBS 962.96]
MPGNDKPLKNSLNISLAESAVFLRTNDTSGRNRYNDSRPTMLRGLLTLELVKPTRISSIQLELQARSSIAWPEGVGAHRTDVTEVHKVYSSTQSVFKAGTNARTASMGTEFASTEDIDFEDEDASTLRNRSQGAQSPSVGTARSSSITSRPTNRSARRTSVDSWYRFRGTPSLRSDDAQSSIIENMPPTPPYSPSISTTASSSLNHIPYTTQSAVSSRAPSIHSPSITTASSLHGLGYPPSSFHGLDQVDEDSIYQEARIGWREDSQQHRERREQRQSGSFASRSRSVTSSRSIRSHSGRPSVDDVPEQAEAEAGPSNFNYESQFTSSPTSDEPHSVSTHEPSRSPSLTRGRKKRFSVSSVTSLIKDVVRIRSRSVKRDSRDESEKKRKRRSSSVFSWMSRGTERDDGDKTSISRGRTMEKDSRSPTSITDGSNSAYGVANASATNEGHSTPGINSNRQPNETDGMSVGSGARGESPTPAPSVQSGTRDGRTSRTSFRLSGILDHHKEGVDERRNEGDGWKEFKKGIYTYPICFQVPGHAPPSLEATFGSVTWRLKASVHRPGAFSSKMSTQRDVLVLSCPSEEDTEDTENIIVERHWDGQLQYLISISGRSFYVGGTIPISFTMLPLAKVRVHRLSVILEEKVEYHNNFRSVGRTDPVSTTQLLSVREEGKGRDAKHILPLESDDTNALLNSPLYPVLNLPSEEYARDEALTDMASTLMGPGPWTFHQELQLPASCRSLHPTNKNRRSNISITHLLKCIMRVERGDDQAVDEKTGKRKLFDIVVQTPVMILACRCNPEWTALPYYSEHLEDPTSIAPQCPCVTRRLEREHEMTTTDSNSPQVSPSFHGTWPEGVHRLSSDSSQVSNAETSPLHNNMTSLRNRDNLILRNSQFERLVSGQESELGESPPPYEKEIPPNSFKIGAPYQTAMFVSAVH